MSAYNIPIPATPLKLGLPSKFSKWRLGQADMVDFAANSTTRFSAICAPCGSGKSLTVMAAALAHGGRTCILTSTKGLQRQLLFDFGGPGGIGLVNIEGRSNYRCHEGGTCDASLSCRSRNTPACPHGAAVIEAQGSRLVVSNYAAWIASHKYGRGWGDFDLLVLDECADAPDHLAGALQVILNEKEVRETLGRRTLPESASLGKWQKWGTESVGVATGLIKEMEPMPKDAPLAMQEKYRRLQAMHSRVKEIAAMEDEEWLIDGGDEGIVFDCIRPSLRAEDTLFRGVKRVLLVSATVRPMTLDLLGIPDVARRFADYPSTFDPVRCPIYHIPSEKLNAAYERSVGDWGSTQWMLRINQILAGRADRRGLIHTVSFERARNILDNSAYSDRMMENVRNRSLRTAQLVERFKLAPRDAVLVSPAISTGYDFPYQLAEFAICAKVPYLQPTRIQRARGRHYRHLDKYQTMQRLQQSFGRHMRSQDDCGESFVVDDAIEEFMARHADFASQWVHDRFSTRLVIPPAPPRLGA